MTWSAKQYLAFEDERNRPIRDLLYAVPVVQVRTAIDIGCGPGNSTELLAARFPQARVSGIDSSQDMIATARKRLPAVDFELQDIETWVGQGARASSFDAILANAVLQWVPNHAQLLPALIERLVPQGWLAVQMPDNLGEPAQLLMREIAHSGPWSGKFAAAAEVRVRIESPDWYYRHLRSSGCTRVDVWRTTYHHPLAGAAGIVEWFKGSGLRPFLDPLTPAERAEYLARYTAAIETTYPALPDGTVVLPFPRLFIVAVR